MSSCILSGSCPRPARISRRPIPASSNARRRRRWHAGHMAAVGVLIVDDNLLFLEAARDRLEQGGLRVVGVAATSAEALRRGGGRPPGGGLGGALVAGGGGVVPVLR